MSEILSREGARPRLSRFFLKAIVQSVLIFFAETWVFTPRMGKVLGGFQEKVADTYGEDPTSEAEREVGVHLIGGGKSGGRV